MPTPPDFTAGTSLAAASLNKVGLWLVKTQTVGTGVTSVTVTNAFSADYDNYLVHYTGGTKTTTSAFSIQLGPQTTQSEYYGILVYSLTTSGTIAVAVNNNNNRCDWIGGGEANQESFAKVDVLGPFRTGYTKIRNGSYQDGKNFGTYQGEHQKAVSYTDFTLVLPNGTMTGGTIRVYGYRN